MCRCRAALAAACLIRRLPFWLTPTALGFYAVTGLLCLALPNVAMFLALGHIPAGVMAMIVALMPMLTYCLTLSLRFENFTLAKVAGIACGFLGVLLIIGPRMGLPTTGLAPWVILAVATPALFSIGNVYVARRRPPESDAMALGAGMLIMAALGSLFIPWRPDNFIFRNVRLAPSRWRSGLRSWSPALAICCFSKSFAWRDRCFSARSAIW